MVLSDVDPQTLLSLIFAQVFSDPMQTNHQTNRNNNVQIQITEDLKTKKTNQINQNLP